MNTFSKFICSPNNLLVFLFLVAKKHLKEILNLIKYIKKRMMKPTFLTNNNKTKKKTDFLLPNWLGIKK